MTTSIVNFPLIGSQLLSNSYIPDTVQRHPLGTILEANDPFYGGGEYIYLKSGASSNAAFLFNWDSNFTTVVNPVTANVGRPIATSLIPTIINTYQWYQIAGQAPLISDNSIASGTAIGISTTNPGRAATVSAGRQILSAISVGASTTTIIKTGTTVTGSTAIKLPNLDGLFQGLAVSGTGIPGGTTLSSIDFDSSTGTLSAAATASGIMTATFTFTGYILAEFNRWLLQGQIT